MSLYLPPGNGMIIDTHPSAATLEHPAHPSNMPTHEDNAALMREVHARHMSQFSWMPATHSIVDLRQR